MRRKKSAPMPITFTMEKYMKQFALSLITLVSSSALADFNLELSMNQFHGQMKSYYENVEFHTNATSLSLKSDVSDKLAIRTAVGYSNDFTKELFKSGSFARVNAQYTILNFSDLKAPSGEHLYLAFGFSEHRLWTTAGKLDYFNSLTGIGFEHYSQTFGWSLEALQNVSLTADKIKDFRKNKFLYTNLSFGLNYKL